MKDNLATIIAVGGVVIIALGVVASSLITGQPMGTETLNMAITGLIGFAAGGVAGTVIK